MPWSAANQIERKAQAAYYKDNFDTKMAQIRDEIKASGAPVSIEPLGDLMRRWSVFVNTLQTDSDTIASNENAMESLSLLAAQNADYKAQLSELRNQALTRSDQADSVNPKIRSSPYTNLLGLHRVFRDSTRFGLLMSSIVFGVGALVAGGIFAADVWAGNDIFPGVEIKDG
jgi:hypothetical protein